MWNDDDLGRPSGRDRRSMIKQVDAAVATGCISPLDRTSLLHSISTAATRGELARTASELSRLSNAAHHAAYAPTPHSPPAQGTYAQGPQGSAPAQTITAPPMARRRFRPGCLLALFVAAVILAPLVGGLVMVVSSFRSLVPSGVASPDIITAEGVNRLVTDVGSRFGSTEVVEVNLYDDYAMVVVPADGSTSRTITYQYDGDFDDVFTKGSRTPLNEGQSIDLAEVDADAVMALVESTPAAVGLPGEPVSHVSIRPAIPLFQQDDPSVYVYVNSDFGETGYVRADLTGKVLDTHQVPG